VPVNNLYLLLAFVTGAGVAAQSVINTRLGFLLGGAIWAAAAQFVVGLMLLLLVAAATRQPAPVNADLGGAPWWVWTGGAFGAAFIVVAILLTARIGATLTLASLIAGQLTAALIVDHYGLFGGTVVRLTPLRLTGVALLLLGVSLIRWKAS
jgi:bacterial/archaeal transporter family-2 protein